MPAGQAYNALINGSERITGHKSGGTEGEGGREDGNPTGRGKRNFFCPFKGGCVVLTCQKPCSCHIPSTSVNNPVGRPHASVDIATLQIKCKTERQSKHGQRNQARAVGFPPGMELQCAHGNKCGLPQNTKLDMGSSRQVNPPIRPWHVTWSVISHACCSSQTSPQEGGRSTLSLLLVLLPYGPSRPPLILPA